MLSYLLKRAITLLFAFWVIVTATFFLMKSIPGDPFVNEKAIPHEILQSLYKHYGLDEPLLTQYGKYLASILKGNFGYSFKFPGRSVNQIIFQGFPVSALLGIEALSLALTGGIFLGSIAAYFQNKIADRIAMIAAILGISVPSFIVAVLLQYILAVKLDLFPVALWGNFSHTVLPAVALSLLPLAFIARLTRASVLETLSMDYIKTANSKGISPLRIYFHHVLRNSVIPVVAYLGTLTVNLLTGSFVIEKIFGIPGLGQWFINSVSNRDYPVIMGLTIFYSAFLLLVMLCIDLIYPLIDPRIKLGNKL